MTYPITPPPELVSQCMEMFRSGTPMEDMCKVAAQWGADQELNECCEFLLLWYNGRAAVELVNKRRPKLPTLKEQALIALHAVATGANDTREQHQDLDTIRKALEALPQ